MVQGGFRLVDSFRYFDIDSIGAEMWGLSYGRECEDLVMGDISLSPLLNSICRVKAIGNYVTEKGVFFDGD